MTTLAVLADPPRPGLGFPGLTPPIDPAEAADLYAATLADTFVAVAKSGGDLLVNYRADEDLPASVHRDQSVEAELRTIAEDAIGAVEDVRFEVQVGSSLAARAGNTATHLLEEEGVESVAILDGTAPFLSRPVIDAAAMKLRRSELVIGPSAGGHVAYVGLTAPIDFEDAWAPPELTTLTARGRDAGLDVDFIERQPVLRTEADLVTVVSEIDARRRADRAIPAATATVIDRLDLRVVEREGERRIATD